ncbi:protein deadpan-like isoform X1 [Tachypleus tridentatus]
MEKRRRARINQSLSELKSLLLDAIKSANPRQSKLEKADILEMTVRHLQDTRRQHRTAALVNDPQLMNKFLLGFEECVREVESYLKKEDSFKEDTLQRLLQHLVQRSEDLKTVEDDVSDTISPILPFSPHVQNQRPPYCHLLESHCHIENNSDTVAPSTGQRERLSGTSNSHEYCALGVTELRLVPKRLANGDFALVLPYRLASSVINCVGGSSRNGTILRLVRPGSESSTFHKDTSSTVSSPNKADCSTFGNSETSDFSSDESLVKSQEGQEVSLRLPADHYLEDVPRNPSSFIDNVWRPW